MWFETAGRTRFLVGFIQNTYRVVKKNERNVVCVTPLQKKLQFSSQDEKYVGWTFWRWGGANLRISFFWGIFASSHVVVAFVPWLRDVAGPGVHRFGFWMKLWNYITRTWGRVETSYEQVRIKSRSDVFMGWVRLGMGSEFVVVPYVSLCQSRPGSLCFVFCPLRFTRRRRQW